MEVIDPEFKVYGHILRYYWNFIQNYSSVFSEFLTMEEFRSEYNYFNTTALDKRRKQLNTTEKINSHEVYSQINVVNASLILPSSIIGGANSTNYQQQMMNKKHLRPKLKFQEVMVDLRSTDEYSNLYVHSSPIRCMVPLTDQEQSNMKGAGSGGLANTFLSIDSFTLKQQSWKGQPPEYLVYSKSLHGDVGKVKVQLFDCQIERLVHSLQAFALQYRHSFDARCFDFREKEHVSSSRVTNDNPDEIDYPALELAIAHIHCDVQCIDISIHHNINMFRYQHITRCICPYGIRIKSSSEATLEFAKRTVITCSKIELQHLISTTKPAAFSNPNSGDQEVKSMDSGDQRPRSSHRGGRVDRGRGRRGRNQRGKSPQPQPSVTGRRQKGKGKAQRRKHEKMSKGKAKDELLCVGSLDSHFQIILTTERSDQEMYQSKQRDFETRQLQQTEDDVEMDQDC